MAKYYHKAIIFALSKKILEQPFSFDLSREGFSKLVERVEFHARQQKANQIVVVLESTGHYYESLVEPLRARGYTVFLFNPYATLGRKQLHNGLNDNRLAIADAFLWHYWFSDTIL